MINLLSAFYFTGIILSVLTNTILQRSWIIEEMDDEYNISKKTPNLLLFCSFYSFSFSIFALTFKWHILFFIIILIFNFINFCFFEKVSNLDLYQSLFVAGLGVLYGYLTFIKFKKERKQWAESSP